ncbi:MAG: substrate-binding domain-containing protein [Clostridia bacterium]|nr:substrate-binding domain-containing protein [Clostridia bacterium]
MKHLAKILLYYAWIPLLVSIPGMFLGFFGLFGGAAVLVPLLAAVVYLLFRKKLDLRYAAAVNGIVCLALLLVFTLFMVIAKGNADGVLLSYFSYLTLPFAPMMLICFLAGKNLLLYVTAICTYAASFLVSAVLGKRWGKRIVLSAAVCALCAVVCVYCYANRPEVKYGGHGFDYMHGYSSTDFTDYTVYAEPSKLALTEHSVDFIVENEDDMPVLDGAEACYPLYAAFAKAAYRDIDNIERGYLNTDYDRSTNGKIVTFTNSVRGYIRLLFGEVDLFFGARPSAEQMKEAAESGKELVVTPIAKEAFVFFVEADNPVDNLTSDEIRAIYHGDITDWSEVGGAKQEIIAFQRPANSGSQTMMEYFMGDVTLKEPKTYEKVDAMVGVIRHVAQYANENGAVGYSFRYFLEELNQEKGVKMLSVDGVYPSKENIENGSYPLVTNVCLITRKDNDNPNVQKMIDFILSEDGQEIIKKTGYSGIR